MAITLTFTPNGRLLAGLQASAQLGIISRTIANAPSLVGVASTTRIGTIVRVNLPIITTNPIQSIAENTPISFDLAANEAGTWAITGGLDANLFVISGSSVGADSADFEIPEDNNGDNVYQVQITFTSTGTGLTDTKTFQITVTNVNEGGNTPFVVGVQATANLGTLSRTYTGNKVITGVSSASGIGTLARTGAPSILSSMNQTIPENSPFSLDLVASEAGGNWVITGGADASLFQLSNSNVDAEALDYELPEDANGDNVYDVQVTFISTITGLSDTKTFHVTVTDVNEAGSTSKSITGVSSTGVISSSGLGKSLNIFGVISIGNVGGISTNGNLKNVSVIGVSTAASIGSVAMAPRIISDPIQTVDEETPFSLSLIASEAGTWAITGGPDSNMFQLSNSSVGAESLDFELPEDSNTDNLYDVQVTFTSSTSGLTDTKIFHLTVVNIDETANRRSITGVSSTSGVGTLTSSTGALSPAEGTNLILPNVESDLTNSGFIKSGQNIIVNADGVADGLAYLSGGSTSSIVLAPSGAYTVVQGNQYRMSLRVKKAATNGARYVISLADETNFTNAGGRVVFDLDTNSVVAGTQPTAINCSAGVVDEGNGYKLLWVKFIQKTSYAGYTAWQMAEVTTHSYSEIGNGTTPNQYWKIWKLENLGAP